MLVLSEKGKKGAVQMLFNLRKAGIAGVAVLACGLASAFPLTAHAGKVHDGPLSAVSLGLSEPTDQQIQDELNYVAAQGYAVRVVVRHKVVPTMDMLDHGRKVTVSNAPAVEFQIGRMPGEVWPTATTPAMSALVRIPAGRSPLGARLDARSGHRAGDSSYSINWTANSCADACGFAHFYFTAHYNLSCQNKTCTANTYMVSHQSYNQTQGETLYAYEENPRCVGAGDNWTVDGGNFNTPESFNYTNFSTCPQYNTWVFFEGYWGNAIGQTFDNFFGDRGYPGNYVSY